MNCFQIIELHLRSLDRIAGIMVLLDSTTKMFLNSQVFPNSVIYESMQIVGLVAIDK